MKLRRLTIALSMVGASALGLVGCGGSSNDYPEIVTLEGAVMDDLIANAQICVDANRNSNCDSTEDSTYSNDAGNFQFNTADSDSVLLSVADPNTSIYVDGTTFTRPIVNVAPPSSSVISPFSSLVQIGVEQNIFSSVSAANASLATSFNLTAGTDFRRFNYETDTSTSGKKAKVAARVVQQTINRVFQTASQTLDNTSSGIINTSNINRTLFDAAVRSIVQPSTGTLTSINTNVDTAISIATENGGDAADVSFNDDGLLNVTVGGTSIVSSGTATGSGTVSVAIPSTDDVTIPSGNDLLTIIDDVAENLGDEDTQDDVSGASGSGGGST